MKPPLSDAERVKSLQNYNLMDSAPEQGFDDLVMLASQICQTPIALISLVDENRQWFKANVGLKASETSRSVSFCSHAIEQPNQLMEVNDATKDIRFEANALVTGDPNIRFYAGMPLVTPSGAALGTLCVIDQKPRNLSWEQRKSLEALSRQVMAQMELRKQVLHFDARSTYYESILESAGDVVYELNSEGIFTYLNKYMRGLTGYGKEALEELHFQSIIHPEDREQVAQYYADILHKQQSEASGEFRVIHKNGNSIWVSQNVRLVYNDNGHMIRSIGVVRDISKSKDNEAVLTRYKQMLDGTNDVARIGTWEVDLEKNIPTWSKVTREIHEVAKDFKPNLETAINFYKEGESRNSILASFQRAVEEGKRFDSVLEIVTAKGNAKWVRAIGLPVMKEGKCLKLHGMFQDITNQKTAELQLRHRTNQLETANADLERFAYILTHDLKLPLSNISGHLEILKMEIDTSSEIVKESMHWLDESLEQANAKIIGILKVARHQVSSPEASSVILDIRELIDKSLASFSEKITETNAQVNIKISPDLRVTAPESLLVSAFENIIGNALKYNQPDAVPVIEISCEQLGEQIYVHVKDNGLGMDLTKNDAKIFSMFGRMHEELGIEGHGMGLYLTRKGLENAGGTIEVVSKPGAGSTFSVGLPVETITSPPTKSP